TGAPELAAFPGRRQAQSTRGPAATTKVSAFRSPLRGSHTAALEADPAAARVSIASDTSAVTSPARVRKRKRLEKFTSASAPRPEPTRRIATLTPRTEPIWRTA